MSGALASILARPIAHRGLHARSLGIIENSLQAAEAAMAAGFGIECDVQLSSDGEPVVFHDDDLERLTHQSGPVADHRVADLRAMRLRDSQSTIPSLIDILALIGGRVPLVVEIKSRGDGDLRLAERTAALVATYRGALALKSFDPRVMDRCRQRGSASPLGLVGPSRASSHRAGALSAYDFLSWNIADVSALRSREPAMPLMSWTVRSAEDHACAARNDAQIVFEDYRPHSAPNLPRH